MSKLFFVACLVMFLSCSVEPEPLAFGKDACHTCKMTLMDKKFGAELVTKKGKIYKFDDVNCMLNFYHSGYELTDDFKHILAIDFAHPEKLIEAKHSLYLKSTKIHSPMASGVAVFQAEDELESYNKEWRGILMTWGEIQTQYK